MYRLARYSRRSFTLIIGPRQKLYRVSFSGTMATSASSLLIDAKHLVPELTEGKYKGQAGKIGVVGGCREYTGAPYFASMSALRIGADLSHVFCTEGAATVIKSYSPELIVHPYLPTHSEDVAQAIEAIKVWIDRFDSMLVGPGLGREVQILDCAAAIIAACREKAKPLVIDADGLWLINQRPDLIRGYSKAILTPNKVEFDRLAKVCNVDPDLPNALQQLCQVLEGPLIIRKGSTDSISDGKVELHCNTQGSLRRAGGQGDVLSGCAATFAAWATVKTGGCLPIASWAACHVTRMAASRAFVKHRRAMGATHLLEELGPIMTELFD